ncbi:hypothetical protein [Thiohalomonas denitrificans]|uniref:Uncharacterized protein n=1 Tax=Thiohalomonas denitrificans TaxID=415747 RepID=A0A1G5Q2Q1_9GAMM|nr:hypothetical protein [Thiohalomonas denitrificans]SCZ55947.1 hypothetical protein SAMN03097708_01233 [Thiohalomonas denitrificans]
MLKPIIKGSIGFIVATTGYDRRSFGVTRLIVLMYHRVWLFEEPNDSTVQPGMAESADTIKSQLDVLTSHHRLAHLSKWFIRFRSGAPHQGIGTSHALFRFHLSCLNR